jgi:outer membrane cobalamin receptor
MPRAALLILFAALLNAQSDVGELRIRVTDPAGLAVPASIEISSEANDVDRTLQAAKDGTATARRLRFGIYRIKITQPGFATSSELIEVRTAAPKDVRVTLGVAPVETTVNISDSDTLIDPYSASSVNRVGSGQLQDRLTSLPGRSLIDLINSQPGWLLEANAVLHPRGSEYQTQYIVDGIPLTENRSPGFSPELEADDVQSMTILTAGYPAEYGRKLGGVIDVTTAKDSRPGFHGKISTYGGSFDTFGGAADGQYSWGRSTAGFELDAARTDRYLDPPVQQNFTNAGTNFNGAIHYEFDLSERDRFGFTVRSAQSRFGVPNEFVQELAGQRQNRGGSETAGLFWYTHVFGSNVVGDIRGMSRDLSATLWSNDLATPIIASQNRGYRESYVKASLSAHENRHELKFGVEGDFGTIRENFAYSITDPTQFDPGTPLNFQFAAHQPDREEAIFAQDQIRLGKLTLNAGVRIDHYSLLENSSAVSPRIGAAYYWEAADLVLRSSYDRIFQTPAFENILLASSPQVQALNDNVLRLPVLPSLGNFYEAGFTKGLFKKLRIDATYYKRSMSNFADDDLLLNTGVSFPIAFSRAEIHGEEVKLEIPRWGKLSGFISYSNMNGVGYLPVTGGLFLGDNAAGALSAGSFPITQDQRNTVQSRFHYQVSPRWWVAFGGAYGSGLPVEFDGTYADALAQYGQAIVNRVNFEAGRVRPNFTLNASAGAIVWRTDKQTLRFQADVQNLTDRLNVLDFAGLFSGTAIASPRSVSARLQFGF